MKPILIHTDGSCDPDTQRGGWAAILRYGEQQRVIQGQATETTNNAMELTAVIQALKALKPTASPVQIFSDSSYVVRGANEWLTQWCKRGWKTQRGEPLSNRDLWQHLKLLLDKRPATLTWIPREQNYAADQLAQAARQSEQMPSPSHPVTAETAVLVAGSRYASQEAQAYARRVVQRLHQLGHTILVGDAPYGIDKVVVQECQRLHAKVIVVGVTDYPRNGGCSSGSYIKLERDTYRGAGGYNLNRYQVRDRWMADQAVRGMFIWNGESRGTKSGYDYMCSRGKEAHLVTFALKAKQHD